MKEFKYITVEQENSEFYLCSMDIEFLRKTLNFHFRDPYQDEYKQETNGNFKKYMERLRNKGIHATNDPEGLQRRLSLSRVLSIANEVESGEFTGFPTTVVLAYNSTIDDQVVEKFIKGEPVELHDEMNFTIIDGQHRLAGILSADPSYTKNISIPVSLYLNISLSDATRLFAEINGKQKAVSKSLIYDLYENVDSQDYVLEAKLHNICKTLNYPPENFGTNSPFYRQIKMLGTGKGTISQAFFIEYYRSALKNMELESADTQKLYSIVFNYFRAVQKTFHEDWPDTTSEWGRFTDTYRSKSQLRNTNGIGALFRFLPHLYNYIVRERGLEFSAENISKFFSILPKNFWRSEYTGTGKIVQEKIAKQLLHVLVMF